MNISGAQQNIVNRKMALQTMDTPAEANLIRCTLVHKRLKQDRSSDHPTDGHQAGHCYASSY